MSPPIAGELGAVESVTEVMPRPQILRVHDGIVDVFAKNRGDALREIEVSQFGLANNIIAAARWVGDGEHVFALRDVPQ